MEREKRLERLEKNIRDIGQQRHRRTRPVPPPETVEGQSRHEEPPANHPSPPG